MSVVRILTKRAFHQQARRQPPARRYATTVSERVQKAFVLGATGQMGMASVVEGIKQGYHVYGTSRSSQGIHASQRFTPIPTPGDSVRCPQFWQQTFSEQLEEGDEVVVINTIGAASAPTGVSLRDVNVTPVVAAAKGLEAAAAETSLKSHRLVHLSSLAALYLQDDYGATKREAERALLPLIGSGALTILRVGYAYNNLKMSGFMIKRIDTEHAWGPEQMAGLPVQFLFEHGRHPLQPVYVGDVIDACYATPRSRVMLIDAVSHEVLTTAEFFKFFRDLAGKKFRPCYLPYDVAEKLAHHFPLGHFAPFAIEGCRRMDEGAPLVSADSFIELLGRQTRALSDVYRLEEGEQLLYAKPPLVEHTKLVAKKCLQDPSSLLVLAECSVKVAGCVLKTFAQTTRTRL
ncbi:MAG: hypothetical protein S4CHLAM2_12960 [Chlamydiales bacterium]|nr:hypothetical protein [Chlamydiales bacterium]